ncbi:MAG: hypothetical protein V3W08_11125 [Candidatus Binatia bacterium]
MKRLSSPDQLPTMDELWRDYVKHVRDRTLLPKFDELLADAMFFVEQLEACSGNPANQARYARAVIVFSSAAIEAVTNDALVTIDDLMQYQPWPMESIKEPPFVYFRRLSHDRVRRLQKRGSVKQKVEYILSRLETGEGPFAERDLATRMRQLARIRIRIVHMSSLSRPHHLPSVMNPKQVRNVAKIAVNTALEYCGLVEEGFSRMNLPIQVMRP